MLQVVEGRQWDSKHNKLDEYRLTKVVRLIQHMAEQKRLILVGLSAMPASTPPVIPPFAYALNLEGQRHIVQCEYHNMLLPELLKPAKPEMLVEARPLEELL